MSKHTRIKRVAEKLGGNADSRYNVVAIVEKSGNVLSIGRNNTKTHPAYFNGEFDKGIHAEFDAIKNAPYEQLSKANIHIFYFKKDGSLGDSEPCDYCKETILRSGISKAYFYKGSKLKTASFKHKHYIY
jgi:deoxycytidylate deaminase